MDNIVKGEIYYPNQKMDENETQLLKILKIFTSFNGTEVELLEDIEDQIKEIQKINIIELDENVIQKIIEFDIKSMKIVTIFFEE